MKYFWITLKHKWYVLLAGLKLGVPLYLLLLHDWTKFTFVELPHYQRQFFGKADQPFEFSCAWLHHQHSNKHHWEYWIPVTGHNRGGYRDMEPLPMPDKYVREMLADWVGASRAYEGKWPTKSWPWLENNIEKILKHCHHDTVKLIEKLLCQIEDWR